MINVLIMTPKEVLNNFMKENVSPFMKENGFTKSDKTWTKKNDNITYVFNIQSNKWNITNDPVKVFINYGVYSAELYKKQFKLNPLPKSPKEYDCYIRKRLLNEDNASETWIIGLNGKETSKVGMLNLIKSVVFTFFDEY